MEEVLKMLERIAVAIEKSNELQQVNNIIQGDILLTRVKIIK
jgi:hypothetical protein